jgi:hypothetical protein
VFAAWAVSATLRLPSVLGVLYYAAQWIFVAVAIISFIPALWMRPRANHQEPDDAIESEDDDVPSRLSRRRRPSQELLLPREPV